MVYHERDGDHRDHRDYRERDRDRDRDRERHWDGPGAPWGGNHGNHNHDRPKMRRPVFDATVLYIRWEKMRRLGGPYLTKEPWLIPPRYRPTQPRFSIPARHLHSVQNKQKSAINVVKWTPDGHRLLTCSAAGDITLWDGKAFNFVTVLSSHNDPIRAVDWSGSNEWLLSADQAGVVKYFTPQLNNTMEFQAHRGSAIRDLTFAPTDIKFVTASDDSTLKVWDFGTAEVTCELKGHGWDVKSCDWHPEKGLVVSGSRDHTVKLWDPRDGKCLTTLHGHKTWVTKTRFGGRNGLCLATAARDSSVRIFDLRAMRDMLLLRSNEKDITTVTWHPHHPSMVSTGSNDGAINHYILTNPNPPAGQPHGLSPYDTDDPASAPMQNIYPAHLTKYAHDQAIWSMDWNPDGLIFATGSNDRATRFWVRPLPSNTSWQDDQWHKGPDAAPAWRAKSAAASNQRGGAAAADDEDDDDEEVDPLEDHKVLERPSMPGLGLPGLPPRGLPGLGSDDASIGGAQSHPSLGANQMPALSNMGGPRPFHSAFPTSTEGGMLPPDRSSWPNGVPPPPPGWVPPPGFPMPPGLGGDGSTGAASIRRRGPLPSQEESYTGGRKKY